MVDVSPYRQPLAIICRILPVSNCQQNLPKLCGIEGGLIYIELLLSVMVMWTPASCCISCAIYHSVFVHRNFTSCNSACISANDRGTEEAKGASENGGLVWAERKAVENSIDSLQKNPAAEEGRAQDWSTDDQLIILGMQERFLRKYNQTLTDGHNSTTYALWITDWTQYGQ